MAPWCTGSSSSLWRRSSLPAEWRNNCSSDCKSPSPPSLHCSQAACVEGSWQVDVSGAGPEWGTQSQDSCTAGSPAPCSAVLRRALTSHQRWAVSLRSTAVPPPPCEPSACSGVGVARRSVCWPCCVWRPAVPRHHSHNRSRLSLPLWRRPRLRVQSRVCRGTAATCRWRAPQASTISP